MSLQKLVPHSEIVVDVSLGNAKPSSQQLGLRAFSSLLKLLSVEGFRFLSRTISLLDTLSTSS